MDIRLQGGLILGILFFASLLVYYLIKGKLNLKYCLVWILAVVVMLIATIFPEFIERLATAVGIKTPSNFIFVLYGLFMLLIVFTLTAIVSHMNKRIFKLVQNQALLEARIRSMERKVGEEERNENRNCDISRNK